jgi:predicted aminopeptidase
MFAVLLSAVCIFSLTACTSIAYYSQATVGHLSLLIQRRPIDTVLQDPALDNEIKAKLREVQKIRDFASNSLSLPDNDSYRSFADIKRQYVVWNVFATPSLSLTPIESCFFVVGCLSYRGYYAESDARAFGDELRAAGHDVYVGGVAAYSTLGWFDDPVLNTMFYWDNRRLAKLIFHELTHQLLYVKNDALFNESFATGFAELGLQRWLQENTAQAPSLGQANSEQTLAALPASPNDEKTRETAFIEMLLDTQEQLKALFSGTLSDQEKLRDKALIFSELRGEYKRFKERFSYSGYDTWMSEDLNNAKISSVVTYHSYDNAFKHLLQQVDNDIDQFITVVKAIAALQAEARHECLVKLTTDQQHRCDI